MICPFSDVVKARGEGGPMRCPENKDGINGCPYWEVYCCKRVYENSKSMSSNSIGDMGM
jgi:hypothetical protein